MSTPAATPEALVLTPPLGELPPPWWENPVLPGAIAAGAVLSVAAFVIIRRIRKNRPPVRPAVTALAALAEAEGPVAITGALRGYLGAVAPALHAGLTREEIERLAASGTELPADDWLPLLRETDAAKYAGGAAPSGLRERAITLVRASETNLEQRRLAATSGKR